MQTQEDERDVQSPSWDIPLIPQDQVVRGNARGHLHNETGRDRIIRARRRLGAVSPKPAIGVYIDW
jgi:hypothetical protein